jgi:hypothetical protein
LFSRSVRELLRRQPEREFVSISDRKLTTCHFRGEVVVNGRDGVCNFEAGEFGSFLHSKRGTSGWLSIHPETNALLVVFFHSQEPTKSCTATANSGEFTTIQYAREEADRNSCCTLQFILRKYPPPAVRRSRNRRAKVESAGGFGCGESGRTPDRFGTWTSSIPNIISALRSAVGILRFVWKYLVGDIYHFQRSELCGRAESIRNTAA